MVRNADIKGQKEALGMMDTVIVLFAVIHVDYVRFTLYTLNTHSLLYIKFQ